MPAIFPFGIGNERVPPRRPTVVRPAPPPTMVGTVEIHLEADQANGTISLLMAEPNPDPDPERHLIGQAANGEYYLRVPKGETVQVDLVLSGSWDWKYYEAEDGVTLGRSTHARRYWLIGYPAYDGKTIRIIIESSGFEPSSVAADRGQHDEKFNINVLIRQDQTNRPLVLEIDPITKNPPPGDGRKDPASNPQPML